MFFFRLCLGVWRGREGKALRGCKIRGKIEKSFKKFKRVVF